MRSDSDGARILVVAAQFPYPPSFGFGMRVYQLACQLSSRHEVTLLTYADPTERRAADGWRAPCEVVTVPRRRGSITEKRARQLASVISVRPYHSTSLHTWAMQQAIDDIVAKRGIHIVQLESSVLSALRVPPAAAVVIDEHNIESEVFQRVSATERALSRRVFNAVEYVRFRQFERRWWRRAAGCAVTSARDAAAVRAHAPGTPVHVVPNGVDVARFFPGDIPAAPASLIFNGLLEYRPNLDAAQYLVDDIWPLVRARRPDATLTIVGRGNESDLRRLRRPGVVVTGEVPDVRPHLARAAVVAVPVRMGGGTRLKVVEALAMGRPLVSTTLGCEGIEVRTGEHLLVADDAAGFAAAVLRLFEDPCRGEVLAHAGRALMVEKYSWERSAQRLEVLYEEVLSQGQRFGDAGARRTTAARGPL